MDVGLAFFGDRLCVPCDRGDMGFARIDSYEFCAGSIIARRDANRVSKHFEGLVAQAWMGVTPCDFRIRVRNAATSFSGRSINDANFDASGDDSGLQAAWASFGPDGDVGFALAGFCGSVDGGFGGFGRLFVVWIECSKDVGEQAKA